MVGKVDDLCPFSGMPANECPPDTDTEHASWHTNHMVELGFAEIVSVDDDGRPRIELTYARVSKLELYALAAKIAHGAATRKETIAQLDRWREGIT